VIADPPDPGDVPAPAPGGETGSLGEVRTGAQRGDEVGDLGGVGRSVGVDHDDDVAGRRRETTRQRVALAPAVLGDHPDVRPQPARHRHGVVGGTAVHQHHLVDRRHPLEDVREVQGLVEGGNDDTDRGRADRAHRRRPSGSGIGCASKPPAPGGSLHLWCSNRESRVFLGNLEGED